jgi:hypothetical protein
LEGKLLELFGEKFIDVFGTNRRWHGIVWSCVRGCVILGRREDFLSV